MSALSLLETLDGIRRVYQVCVDLQAGERVLLLTDTRYDAELIGVFALVARDMGAEPVVMTFEPRRIPGEAPPPAAGAAMKAADVILELTSQFAGSSRARVEACQAGARYLVLTQLTRANLIRGGAMWADFQGIKPLADRLADHFTKADTVRFTTQAGTDLVASIKERKGRSLVGLARTKGGYAAPPDIEVGTAPVEGTANGLVVVDAALLLMAEGLLREPIRITVRDGVATAIDGVEAYPLVNMIRQCGNLPEMYNLAEMSIGLNPAAHVTGAVLETEGSLGTAHVALGNNLAYGGHTDAPGHLDCVMRDVTVYLDGECVVDAGKLVADPSALSVLAHP